MVSLDFLHCGIWTGQNVRLGFMLYIISSIGAKDHFCTWKQKIFIKNSPKYHNHFAVLPLIHWAGACLCRAVQSEPFGQIHTASTWTPLALCSGSSPAGFSQCRSLWLWAERTYCHPPPHSWKASLLQRPHSVPTKDSEIPSFNQISRQAVSQFSKSIDNFMEIDSSTV